MAADASDERLFQRLASLGLLKQKGAAPPAADSAAGGSSASTDLPGQTGAALEEPAVSAAAEPLPAGEAATPQASATPSAAKAQHDRRLNELLRRISELTGDPEMVKVEQPVEEPPPAVMQPPRPEPPPPNTPPRARKADQADDIPDDLDGDFFPIEPESFQAANVTEGQVEELLLKYLLAVGTATGRAMAEQVKMPFKLIDDLLLRMKQDQLVVYYGSAPMNDYVYQLTDVGRERARRYLDHCTYFGAVPVSLEDYIRSVKAQSIAHQHPTAEDLNRAFADLLINRKMLERLGPAINSGRGLFLYGAPGNGKTSIAERVTAAFGSLIWIPRAIGIDGEIMRMFDPSVHEEVPLKPSDKLWNDSRVDKRWVRIKRPTIVVGGELTMDNLEVTLNTSTRVCEAPFQLKSNCGTLVIDDFGRQKMSTDQLLNRWIVPLEKRYDFLNLPNGKKIQVPFDQLIIFSTNLEPKDLVDDAFLRRIPYKVEVKDPTEEEYRALMKMMAEKLNVEWSDDALDYLIEKHYLAVNRPFRCCQPRDLLMQIVNYCHYQGIKPAMTRELFDFAVENYFAVM